MKSITQTVNQFYEFLPFNYEGSVTGECETIRRVNNVLSYPPLASALEKPNQTVLDAGCGAGWFTNTVAYYYGQRVTGLDITQRALQRAAEVSKALGLASKTNFVHANLLELPKQITQQRFDIVNSLGVLHHTADCEAAFKNIAALVKEGGYMHLGLYHRYGRKALLEKFAPIREGLAKASSDKERIEIENRGFQEWKRLHSNTSDETFLRSWYRDQCLHPHETQWTLKDTLEWLSACGLTPLQTSINRFEPVKSWKSVCDLEPPMEATGYSKLADGIFYPGFFVVWAQRSSK